MELLERVEQRGKVAATSLYDDVLLDIEEVTSERPIALMPTLVCWSLTVRKLQRLRPVNSFLPPTPWKPSPPVSALKPLVW